MHPVQFIRYLICPDEKLNNGGKRKDADGGQERGEVTQRQTEATYLASLQISVLLWRGRPPPHLHNEKLQPKSLQWLLTQGPCASE